MSRMNSRVVGAIVTVSALYFATPAPDALAAQGRGRGRGEAQKGDKGDQGNRAADRRETVVIDRDAHVRVIHEYARGGSLPPGLAKRRALPPGLRNQVQEKGTLPPGLRRHLVPVPPRLLARFPPAPRYYQRYFAGDDLIVIDTRTNRIAAIIRDVWR
jgi:hypothetical protein